MDSLLARLTQMYPHGADLHTPSLGENEKQKVVECVESTFVSTVGPLTTEAEEKLKNLTGSPHVAVTNNGTSALHLCLHVLGVTSGDLVIVPAMTFAATANAVLYTGAQCLFVDVEPERFAIDPAKLEKFLNDSCQRSNKVCVHKETGRPIRALVLVHVFSIPGRIEAIADICRAWNIEFVEDAAESLGSSYNGRHTGTFGKVAALSFNGNKIVTCGGGGAVMSGDAALHQKIKHISTTAKVPSEFGFFHDVMGFNYRMPNINAALLVAQLGRIDEFLSKKARLHQTYQEKLSGLEEGVMQTVPSGMKSNYWLNNFILNSNLKSQYKEILTALNRAKIRARPTWDLMHTLPYLSNSPRMVDLSTAIEYSQRIISLPSSAHLVA